MVALSLLERSQILAILIHICSAIKGSALFLVSLRYYLDKSG